MFRSVCDSDEGRDRDNAAALRITRQSISVVSSATHEYAMITTFVVCRDISACISSQYQGVELWHYEPAQRQVHIYKTLAISEKIIL